MWERLIRHRLIWFAFTLTLAVLPAGADERWQDRGDRFEGIRPENVGGGDFELLGVHVEPCPLDRQAPRLYVSVPLREATELQVRVWEPESGYWMVPTRKNFQPGKPFDWPRDAVLARRNVFVDQLYVLATDPLEVLHFPARLTTSAPPSEVARYVFRFRSRGGVSLQTRIAREEDGRLIDVRTDRRDERYGGLLSFSWDGRDAAGSVAPAGVYHLKLDGKVYLQSDRDVNVDVRFVHHGKPAP